MMHEGIYKDSIKISTKRFLELIPRIVILVSVLVLINIFTFCTLENVYEMSSNNYLIIMGFCIIYTITQMILALLIIKLIDMCRYQVTSIINGRFKERLLKKLKD